MSPTAEETKRLRERIDARKAAEEILELIYETDSTIPDHCHDHFMESFRVLFEKRPEGSAAAEPMTCQEAANFNLVKMPYGKYAGMHIADIPLTYLDWLIGQKDDIKEKISRYLANDEVAKRLREQLEDAE